MNEKIKKRVVEVANFFIENHSAIRKTALKFGYSKSTIHKDLSKRLWNLDPILATVVEATLTKNKSERHIRGGEATKKNIYLSSENLVK